MTGPKPKEIHELLKQRQFSKGPWALRVCLMCMSFAGLGYVKYNLMKKNQAAKRPNFTVPASRPR